MPLGLKVTITSILLRGPSQPSIFCETYQVRVSFTLVPGTGAITEPKPPTGSTYQIRPLPAAVSGLAGSFSQYTTGLTTVGLAGIGATVIVIAVRGPSQLFTVWLAYQV